MTDTDADTVCDTSVMTDGSMTKTPCKDSDEYNGDDPYEVMEEAPVGAPPEPPTGIPSKSPGGMPTGTSDNTKDADTVCDTSVMTDGSMTKTPCKDSDEYNGDDPYEVMEEAPVGAPPEPPTGIPSKSPGGMPTGTSDNTKDADTVCDTSVMTDGSMTKTPCKDSDEYNGDDPYEVMEEAPVGAPPEPPTGIPSKSPGGMPTGTSDNTKDADVDGIPSETKSGAKAGTSAGMTAEMNPGTPAGRKSGANAGERPG